MAKIPLRTRVVGTPIFVAIVTFIIIFLAGDGDVYRWGGLAFLWYAAFAFLIFWLMKHFGDEPITKRAQIITYSIIIGLGVLQLCGENRDLVHVFYEDNLPYWFVSVIVTTAIELVLLADYRNDGVIDAEFIEVDERPLPRWGRGE